MQSATAANNFAKTNLGNYIEVDVVYGSIQVDFNFNNINNIKIKNSTNLGGITFSAKFYTITGY